MYVVKVYHPDSQKWVTVKETPSRMVAEGYANGMRNATHKVYAVVDMVKQLNSQKFFLAFRRLNTPTMKPSALSPACETC